MANKTYLIDAFSFSSFRSFITNRYKFLLETMRVWTFKSSPTMIVGKAGHSALEVFFRDHVSEAEAVEVGLRYIENVPDNTVDWGKTGSREEVIKRYTFAINAFFAECPQFEEIVGVEEKLNDFITTDKRFGDEATFDLPAVGVPDLIEKTKDGYVIHDWKFVKSYSNPEEDRADRIFQSLFYYHLVKAKYQGEVVACVYHEIKTTENRDGLPQIQPWRLEFADIPEFFALFYKLYGACCDELAKPDITFLPNIFDQMSGKETFQAYASEVVGIDRPKVRQYKTTDWEIELPEKKFVPSATAKAENQNLEEHEKIRLKLQEFGRAVKFIEAHVGPSVVQYRFYPPRGAKMSEFPKYEKDIALVLRATSVRIQAPIPGTDTIGIEVPNANRYFPELTPEMIHSVSGPTLSIPIGMDMYGKAIEADLAQMPHLLVAGQTGGGKSVWLNSMIQTLAQRNSAEDLRMLFIDPKRVELARYASLPHAMTKPIYDPIKAARMLKLLVEEMERRYETLEQAGVRDIDSYNAQNGDRLPKIVLVVDEFGDLILQTRETPQKKGKNQKKQDDDESLNVETLIVRLAQKARAIGIHLVLTTQRPTVKIITGLIKANIPARIALRVTSKIDSNIILDQPGAETLIGKGDLLFLDPSCSTLQRLQGFNTAE